MRSPSAASFAVPPSVSCYGTTSTATAANTEYFSLKIAKIRSFPAPFEHRRNVSLSSPRTNPGIEDAALRTVRIILPYHLRNLAHAGTELVLKVAEPVTMQRVLDALEAAYPMLCGTIREYETGQRRAFLRFFACEEDWSHEPLDAALPQAVAEGREPLVILGAIAGG